MNIVRQPPDSYLCQACCAAMLADCTLDEVLESARLHEAPDGSGKKYLTNIETIRFLLGRWLTIGAVGTFNFVRIEPETEITIGGVEKSPALVGVRSKRLVAAEHAVVWDPERKMILDPQEDEPQPLESYEVYEWWPLLRLESLGLQ